MANDLRPLIAGNWKMNGLKANRGELMAMIAGLRTKSGDTDVLICPPSPLIPDFAAAAAGVIAIGGQDCHPAEKGAFTGDISAEMLVDAGASYVIIGHSERRQYHHENDDLIANKLQAAWRAGLHPILCLGETLSERESGQALDVIDRQLAGALEKKARNSEFSVAYEPIWAIGTGKTPTLPEIEEVHGHMRRRLGEFCDEAGAIRLLYGGSVNPQNAAGILGLGHVNGALVGGASLKAADFLLIVTAALSAAPR